jgi:UDP-2,3-diacylglucosamine hydrolase
MPPKPVYLTSDIHLGGVPSETEASFHRWLRHAASEAEQIVINGDLFDFWFEYRNAIPRGHTRTLGLLAEVVDSGVPIVLFGGNHDWWGGSYLENEVGVQFYRTQQRLDLAGSRVLIAHGDGVGKGDLGYRILRGVLRNPLSVAAFRWMHPDVTGWVAGRVSRTKEREATGHGRSHKRTEAVRAWSESELSADPSLDMVITGHTHSPELLEFEPGRWVLNAGDWVFRKSFAILSPSAPPQLLEWEAEQ